MTDTKKTWTRPELENLDKDAKSINTLMGVGPDGGGGDASGSDS